MPLNQKAAGFPICIHVNTQAEKLKITARVESQVKEAFLQQERLFSFFLLLLNAWLVLFSHCDSLSSVVAIRVNQCNGSLMWSKVALGITHYLFKLVLSICINVKKYMRTLISTRLMYMDYSELMHVWVSQWTITNKQVCLLLCEWQILHALGEILLLLLHCSTSWSKNTLWQHRL